MGLPERGYIALRPAMVAALGLVLVSAPVHIASAQVAAPVLPVPVETPYTLMDDESRLHFEVGAGAPLKGNGPLTGYIYGFLTRPHFLDKDLYLRMVVAPVYASAELIHDRWPTEDSAIGLGLGGGLFAASQAEFRNGRFKDEESFAGDSAEATVAYYHRGPKVLNRLPLEGQIRVRPRYVWYDRTGDTSNRFRLPENSAIYEGPRVGGPHLRRDPRGMCSPRQARLPAAPLTPVLLLSPVLPAVLPSTLLLPVALAILLVPGP